MAKIMRYPTTAGIRYGLVEDGVVFELMGNNPFAADLQKGDAMGEFEHLLLAPPIVPSKIVAVGRNYAAHAAEMNNELPTEPMLFFKPPSALVAFDLPIQLPLNIGRIDQEAELAVVIGKTARRVLKDEALSHVLGYTCGNDVSARVLQKKDNQWGRAKGFDTFNPLGPWIETDIQNPNNLAISARINGQTVQNSNTAYMVFDVATLIEYISHIMTLNPGDVIMTGTPEGVSELHDGDSVEIEIEGIGVLRNPVEAIDES